MEDIIIKFGIVALALLCLIAVSSLLDIRERLAKRGVRREDIDNLIACASTSLADGRIDATEFEQLLKLIAKTVRNTSGTAKD